MTTFAELSSLHEMVEQGYISETEHPTLPFLIYNYTPSCQFDRKWNPATLQARGLILDVEGNVIARGFTKFFNLGELKSEYVPFQIPHGEGFRVFDKLDGSLGIMYPGQDGFALATRGSFTSDQAIVGTQILKERYDDYTPPRGFTACFEIIYPENRIVVDYRGMREVVHLALIDNETGRAHDPDPDWPGPVVEELKFDSLDDLLAEQIENKEGYVVRYDSGLQVKVKFEEYIRLHKIVTGLSSIGVWEAAKSGQSFAEIIEHIPDELHGFVNDVHTQLMADFDRIELEAREAHEAALAATTHDNVLRRRDYALFLQEQDMPHKAIMFRMLDNKPYDEIIWKMVRPEFSKPYATSEV